MGTSCCAGRERRSGRVAVVTGGARGIGRAVVQRFLKGGDSVVIVDHPDSEAEAVSVVYSYHMSDEYLSQRPCCSNAGLPGLDHVLCDVSSGNQVMECVDRILDKHRRIDVLVNAAGIVRPKKLTVLQKLSWDDRKKFLKEVMAVNFEGTVDMCLAVLPIMKKQDYGRIVNVASIAAFRGDAGNLIYASSKAAVANFTAGFAVEAVGGKKDDKPHVFDIRVNAVAPGLTDTTLIAGVSDNMVQFYAARSPLKRLAKPEEIAAPIFALADDEIVSHILGQTIVVDGGYTAVM